MYNNAGVKKLKLPPVIKKRGLPKGAEKTIIGLPARKRLKKIQPVSFLKKSPASRDEGNSHTLPQFTPPSLSVLKVAIARSFFL